MRGPKELRGLVGFKHFLWDIVTPVGLAEKLDGAYFFFGFNGFDDNCNFAKPSRWDRSVMLQIRRLYITDLLGKICEAVKATD